MNTAEENARLAPLAEPYLLATGIDCYVDQAGQRYFDDLWTKDILEHTKYIAKLTLMGPAVHAAPPNGHVNVSNIEGFKAIQFIDLPGGLGTLETLRKLPQQLLHFWRAVRNHEIIHTGVGGWPIPYGWILAPMARIQKKHLVILVESAFWRLTPEARAGLKTRVRAYLTEFLGSWCVNKADLALFTQEDYRKSLLTSGRSPGFVEPASWVDDTQIVSIETAQAKWLKKADTHNNPLKVIFVGRLSSKKGIKVLLKALELLESKGHAIDIDILGEGDLLNDCVAFANKKRAFVKLRVLGTVAYDDGFFRLLHPYHLLVVPTISDEQPRIIYDAFSQALPVFASSTPGNRDSIAHQVNGLLFEPNNALALCEALVWARQNAPQLEAMGMNAAKSAAHLTHSAMHRRRWVLLSRMLTQQA